MRLRSFLTEMKPSNEGSTGLVVQVNASSINQVWSSAVDRARLAMWGVCYEGKTESGQLIYSPIDLIRYLKSPSASSIVRKAYWSTVMCAAPA
jgi:hypothetical protein